MNGAGGQKSAQVDLDPLLRGKELPDEVRKRAEALVKRLTTPVRVTVIGPRSTGKSTVVNLLLGGKLLDPSYSLPTTQFSYGGDVSSHYTLADGSISEVVGFNVAKLATKPAVFVDVKLPLAALKKISVLEVVQGEGPDTLARALSWASPRSDIIIWCSERFTSAEQKVWSTATDLMKDHAYLLLTKIDKHPDSRILKSALNALHKNFSDDFKHILPISAMNAVNTRKRDGSIDKQGLAKSGGQALIKALMRDLETSRQAAIDQAEMILSDYPGSEPAA